MNRKTLLLGVITVSIAIALMEVLTRSQLSGIPTTGNLETPSPDPSRAHQLQEVSPTRTVVAQARIRVIDSQSNVALPGARLMAAPDRVQSTLPNPDESRPSLACDPDGTIPASQLQDAAAWVVSCPGYCTCVTGRPGASTTVPLIRASSLTVLITAEEGGPQEDALLQLRPVRVRATAVPEQNVVLGSGDPRSADPIWNARTDGLGKAVFDTIPGGSYRLIVRHTMSYPTSPEGQGSADIMAPGNAFVRMRDLHAVCFVAPPGDRIERYSWELPATGFDLDPAQYLSSALSMGYLARRFPDAVIRLGRPSSKDPPEIGCRAVLATQSLARGSWALSPIRLITTPVFLEPIPDHVARSVVVRIVDMSGHMIPLNLLLVGSPSEGRRSVEYPTRTDQPIVLEAGNYSVFPEAVPSWIVDDFRSMSFSITKDDPPDVEKIFRLQAPLRLVIITPEPPEGPFEGVAHFAVRSESAHGSYGVMNWSPGRGPIECLMPLGRASIQVQSAVYRGDKISVDIADGIGPQTVPLKLAKRNPSEPYGAGEVGPTRR